MTLAIIGVVLIVLGLGVGNMATAPDTANIGTLIMVAGVAVLIIAGLIKLFS